MCKSYTINLPYSFYTQKQVYFVRKVASNFDDDSLCAFMIIHSEMFLLLLLLLYFYPYFILIIILYTCLLTEYSRSNKTSFFREEEEAVYLAMSMYLEKAHLTPSISHSFLIQYNVICDTLYTHISVDVGSISAIVVLALK